MSKLYEENPMRHIKLYSNGWYNRNDCQFINDMKKLTHSQYFLYDSWENVKMDNVFGMLKNLMHKFNSLHLTNSYNHIMERIIFEQSNLSGSEWLDYSHRDQVFVNRENIAPFSHTYPANFTPIEKAVWAMVKAFRLCGVNDLTDQEISMNEFIGEPDFPFDNYE